MKDAINCLQKFSLGFSFMALPMCLSAQGTIDSTQSRAAYEFFYKTNPGQTEYAKTDLMYLDMGENTSKFYSRHEQIRDSIKAEEIRRGLLSAYEIADNLRKYTKGTKTVVYHFVEENKICVTNNLMEYYTYEEPRSIPIWKIGSEQKKVAGYSCKKATANYLGREWTVFFTPEIPVSFGPWKLWGLPGLILEAEDRDNFFSFRLTGFEQKHTIPIIYTKKTENGQDFNNISKKDFQRLEKLFYEDVLKFSELHILGDGGTVYQTEEQKSQYQKLKQKGGVPHIPLEPYSVD